MQQNFNELTDLCPYHAEWAEMRNCRPRHPFSGIVCEFLHRLSGIIMKHSEAKQFPDVMTFGFFCRRANIEHLRRSYEGQSEGRIGRGVSFHIAPSNVPINFAYSMVSALLAGNACIVKVSSTEFRQITIVCESINHVLHDPDFAELARDIAIIRYPRESELTGYFSSMADLRIIWGGDETIQKIRQFPIPPRTKDLTFADRYSFAIVEAEMYLNQENKQRIAQDFYNDTYLYDQNGCSSPHLIYWLGDTETVEEAKKPFWNTLHTLLRQKQYVVQPVIAVDKLTMAYRTAIDINARIEPEQDNLIRRIQVSQLTDNIDKYRCAGGSFIEYTDISLDALQCIVNRKYQTVAYMGVSAEQLKRFILEQRLTGIDRIVPIGKTTDFSLLWDGYDLILEMSRKIAVQE